LDDIGEARQIEAAGGRFESGAGERGAAGVGQREREEGEQRREQVERQQPAGATRDEGRQRCRAIELVGIGAEQDVAAQHEEQIDHQIAAGERAGAHQMQVVEGDQQCRDAAQSFECVDQGRTPVG